MLVLSDVIKQVDLIDIIELFPKLNTYLTQSKSQRYKKNEINPWILSHCQGLKLDINNNRKKKTYKLMETRQLSTEEQVGQDKNKKLKILQNGTENIQSYETQ